MAGDSILESFPSFIITDDGKRKLKEIGVRGARFDDVEITASDEFTALYPERSLPTFYWLRPEVAAGTADIGTAPDGRLVVSDRALKALKDVGIANAIVKPFEP